MKVRRKVFPILGIALMSLTLLASAPVKQFRYSDVRPKMQELFDLHIDQHQMDSELMRNSLAIYLEDFDRNRLYFTQGEVKRWRNSDSKKIEQAVRSYRMGNLAIYSKLNDSVRDSIIRARQWRTELRVEVEAWLKAGRKPDEGILERKPQFAATESELRLRNGELMLLFATWQMERYPDLKSSELDRVWVLYEKKLRAVENKYLLKDFDGKPMQSAEAESVMSLRIMQAIARGMDPHTYVFDTDEAEALRQQLVKGFTGVGIVLEEGIDGIVVKNVVHGGPADLSGQVKANDRLVEVDGHTVALYPFSQVMSFLRGEDGTTLQLGLVRMDDEGKERHVKVQLTRAPVSVEEGRVQISYERVEGGIVGMITLDSFYEMDSGASSESDLKRAIQELRQVDELKGLVLDLRCNLGGFLSQATRVAGLFLSNGVVAISEYSDGSKTYYRDLDGYAFYSGPLVVLTSRASASAAEIVAQSLQDYGRAVVVGDPQSYGKGSIQHQTITDESSGFYYKVTVGRYYTVSGRSTQIRGVQADIVVPSVLYDDEVGEAYLDNALAYKSIAPAYDDDLKDIDPFVRHWFLRFYQPTLQKKSDFWAEHLPELKELSAQRLESSEQYAKFLEGSSKVGVSGLSAWVMKHTDYQSVEAMSIIKDMVRIQAENLHVTQTSSRR